MVATEPIIRNILLWITCTSFFVFKASAWTTTQKQSRTSTTLLPTKTATKWQQMATFAQSSRKSISKKTKTKIIRFAVNNDDKEDLMLNFMEKAMDTTVGDIGEIDDYESMDLVECIVKAADGRKADNIVALEVYAVTTVCSYMIFLSGNSRPQNQAIAAAILDDVADEFDDKKPSSGVPEGTADSGWMLLDYGDVMVHIMTPKSRLYYNVEGQWREKGAEEVDVSGALIPNTVPSLSDATGASSDDMDIVQDEEDPFWS